MERHGAGLPEISEAHLVALHALRQIYPDVSVIDGGLEIEAADVSVYDVGDCLRPFGVAIRSTALKQVTLDDVFLELTGKELRE